MKISNVRKVQKGCLVAGFSVDLGSVTIHNVKLFEKNGNRWISGPSEKKQDGKYFELVRFDDSMKEKIHDAIVKEIKPWFGGRPSQEEPVETPITDDDIPF
jgi:DNA-binding cell septation regulator SpoVG